MKLVTVAEMQQIEREADAGGLSYEQMMENAGHGLAAIIDRAYAHEKLAAHEKQAGVLALVGSGNNGGDALVALTSLAEAGWRTCAYIVRPRPAEDPLVARLEAAGGKVETLEAGPVYPRLAAALEEFAVWVDGVLGTGFRLPLKAELAEVLDFIRSRRVGLSGLHVVAVDCPSGIDCDSGSAAAEAIPADMTVTMAAVKTGLLKFPAYNLVGELTLAGIGLADQAAGAGANPPAWAGIRRSVATRQDVEAILPRRPLDAHKGTFGTAMIAAGSASYTGAALLAGKAAYCSGAGLVTLAIPAVLHAPLAGHFPEATWVLLPHTNGFIAAAGAEVLRQNLGRASSLLVGPGFGLQPETGEFLNRLLAAPEGLPPFVIDADGLKLLAGLAGWPGRLPAPAVLTPHPGEMAILTGLSTAQIQGERLETAERFAREWGHVVVLKGAFSVIAAPDGRTTVIPVATPALARAGTGDVLAGLIAGLRAQGVEAFDAAVAGAWLHAQAGLRAEQELGSSAVVLAGDVLQAVIPVLAELFQGLVKHRPVGSP